MVASPHISACSSTSFPPVRPITRGPAHHWFGYYDKLAFDPTERYALGMRVGFEGRPPTSTDAIRVGMVDLADGDRWIDLGRSTAWNWQQGCMLQWLPGQPGRVAWNDRVGDSIGSRVLSLDTEGEPRALPRPLYCVAPDGSFGLSIDFVRAGALRAGYGYPSAATARRWPGSHGIPRAPDDDGIRRLDLTTGESSFLLDTNIVSELRKGRRADARVRAWVESVDRSGDGSMFPIHSRSRSLTLCSPRPRTYTT